MSYKYSEPGSYASSPGGMSTDELREFILNMKMDNRDFYDESVDGRVIAPESVGSRHLELDSITVDFLDVEFLSAITADLGEVNAGTLTGVNIYGSRFETLDDETGANITLEGGVFTSSHTQEDDLGNVHQKDTTINQGSIAQIDLTYVEEILQDAHMSFYEPGMMELIYETSEIENSFRVIQDSDITRMESNVPLVIVQDVYIKDKNVYDILTDLDDRLTILEEEDEEMV